MSKCDRCTESKPVTTYVHEGCGEGWCDDCINTYEKEKGVKVGHCRRCGKEKVRQEVGGKFCCPDKDCDLKHPAPPGEEDTSEVTRQQFQDLVLALFGSKIERTRERTKAAAVMFAARMICDSIDMHAIGPGARREKTGYTSPEKLVIQAVRDADLLLGALEKKPYENEEEPDADGKVSEDRY